MRANSRTGKETHDCAEGGIEAEGYEKLHFQSTKGSLFHKLVASYDQTGTSNFEEMVGEEMGQQTADF